MLKSKFGGKAAGERRSDCDLDMSGAGVSDESVLRALFFPLRGFWVRGGIAVLEDGSVSASRDSKKSTRKS